MSRMVVWSIGLVLCLAACSGAGGTGRYDTGDALARASEPAAGVVATRTPRSLGDEPLRLVTLGDAYTAGTGTAVPEADSWPEQLVQAMRSDVRLRLTANLADVAKTSKDVIDEQLWQFESLRPDVVSVLIGVNDVIADISPEEYRANLGVILDSLLATLPPDRIFLITTPDVTLTPRGGDYGSRADISAAVHEANAILADEAASRGIPVIDISPVSDRVPLDPTLVAADGLHPSAKQYAGWVEIIAPRITAVLLGMEP